MFKVMVYVTIRLILSLFNPGCAYRVLKLGPPLVILATVAILPHPMDYVPYTGAHVVGQLQLLMFGALAFALLIWHPYHQWPLQCLFRAAHPLADKQGVFNPVDAGRPQCGHRGPFR